MSTLNEIEANIFEVQGWPIAEVRLTDDDEPTGANFLPDDAKPELYAMYLVETTMMSYDRIVELRYDEFVRLSLIAKAKAWRPKKDNDEEYY